MATDAMARHDVEALIDYRSEGPGADVAHPTADHFVPLLLTLGAESTSGQPVTSAIDGMWHGNSIRSIQAA
jgi:4,5-DOPA dioxygenase extradiol